MIEFKNPSPTQRIVYDALKTETAWLTARQVAARAGMTYEAVKSALTRLVNDGHVTRRSTTPGNTREYRVAAA